MVCSRVRVPAEVISHPGPGLAFGGGATSRATQYRTDNEPVDAWFVESGHPIDTEQVFLPYRIHLGETRGYDDKRVVAEVDDVVLAIWPVSPGAPC